MGDGVMGHLGAPCTCFLEYPSPGTKGRGPSLPVHPMPVFGAPINLGSWLPSQPLHHLPFSLVSLCPFFPPIQIASPCFTLRLTKAQWEFRIFTSHHNPLQPSFYAHSSGVGEPASPQTETNRKPPRKPRPAFKPPLEPRRHPQILLRP